MGLVEGYPVTIEETVRWGDMDAFQHVNNAIFFRFFESCRIAYFYALGDPGFVTNIGVGPIVAETSCRFKIPVTHPDTLSVGVRTAAWYDYGFIQEYVIVSKQHSAVAATGSARVVTFDYAHQTKVKVPDNIRRIIERLEGRELPQSASG